MSEWDTSRVTTMYAMFYKAEAFDQDISSWNVSRITVMNQMFEHATSFNQDISRWDTSRVTNMQQTFSRTLRLAKVESGLAEGDVLYLPIGWWHCVEGSIGRNMILNYWMRMDARKREELREDGAGGAMPGEGQARRWR